MLMCEGSVFRKCTGRAEFYSLITGSMACAQCCKALPSTMRLPLTNLEIRCSVNNCGNLAEVRGESGAYYCAHHSTSFSPLFKFDPVPPDAIPLHLGILFKMDVDSNGDFDSFPLLQLANTLGLSKWSLSTMQWQNEDSKTGCVVLYIRKLTHVPADIATDLADLTLSEMTKKHALASKQAAELQSRVAELEQQCNDHRREMMELTGRYLD